MRTMVTTFSRPGEPIDFSSVEKTRTVEIGDSLRRARFPVSARQLKRWFRRYDTLQQCLNGPELAEAATPPVVQAAFGDLLDLWAYTPLPVLHGRRPAELHMEGIAAGRDPNDEVFLEETRFLPPTTQLEVWPPQAHPGFTLIELLVALSIVAVLAAMAVPALRAAMDRADRTVCLSNLRQLGQAFSEYTADHGHYPAAEMEVTDASGRVIERKRWYHALGPYLDSGPRAWSSGQGRVQVDPVTGQASGIVLPSEDDTDLSAFSPVLRCPTVGHWQLGRNGAYGYNHQYFGDARIVGRDENGKPLRRHYPISPSAIIDKGNTVVLMDSAGTGTEGYRPANRPRSEALGNHSFTVDPPVLPVRGAGGRWGSDSAVPGIGVPDRVSRPHARHRGGCCVLFADGRAQWLPLERLLESDALWNGTGIPGP